MSAGIGAVFQKSGAPSLRDLYVQDQVTSRYEKKQELAIAENQKKEQVKNTYFLNKAFDPSKFGTGNPQGPEITAYLIGKRNEYAQMQKETGMSTAEMMGLINQDMADVQGYLQQSKMFDAVVKKITPEFEKMGFKPSEIDRELRKRIFFDGDTPKPFDKIEWDVEGAMDDLLKNGVDGLTINSSIPAKRLQSRQLSQLSGESYVSNTPNAGTITKKREKGTAYYDPQFDEVKTDEQGVVTGVFKKSAPFTNQDGTPYMNPETGKPADDVITDDNFDYVYNEDKGAKALIDKGVNKRVAALKAKGVDVTDRDIEFLRKDEATEFVYNNSKSRFSSTSGNTTSWRRAERPRAAAGTGSSKGKDSIDFTIAEQTPDGGYKVQGQTGPLKLGVDPSTGRAIVSHDIVMYPDGSTKIEYYNQDRFGNTIGDVQFKYLTQKQADDFVKGNRNLPGNPKPAKRVAEGIKSVPSNENFDPSGGKALDNAGLFNPKKVPVTVPKPAAPKPDSKPDEPAKVNSKTGKKRTLKINYN